MRVRQANNHVRVVGETYKQTTISDINVQSEIQRTKPLRRVPYNVYIDNRVWLTVISPGGCAAGLTDVRNFIPAVPVSSEPLPRSIKPADGQRSLLKGSRVTLFNVRGTANTHMGPTPARWWMSLTSPNDCGLPSIDASGGRADPGKRCVAETRPYCYLGMVSVHGFTPSSPI